MTTRFTTSKGMQGQTSSKARFLVVNSETAKVIRRTDNSATAEKVRGQNWNAEVVDTKPEQANEATESRDRVCKNCGRGHVESEDFAKHRSHWHCIPKDERDRISAEWSKRNGFSF